MSIAGQIAASCQRAIGITLARMMSRRQFGQTLFEHQALRLRMADLQARVDLLRYALHGIAEQGDWNCARRQRSKSPPPGSVRKSSPNACTSSVGRVILSTKRRLANGGGT